MTPLDPPWPFAAVIDFGASDLPVLDFTAGKLSDENVAAHRFAIGRYDEVRPFAYQTPLFTGGESPRNIHMGVDLFSPVGTEVRAFAEGRIHLFGFNGADGDYGHTIITAHELGGAILYALHGHLSAASLQGKREGQTIHRGERLAWVGGRHENGGWVPHLHFQLSFERPTKPDLPGVVSASQRAVARLKYPDPRLVLGPIY